MTDGPWIPRWRSARSSAVSVVPARWEGDEADEEFFENWGAFRLMLSPPTARWCRDGVDVWCVAKCTPTGRIIAAILAMHRPCQEAFSSARRPTWSTPKRLRLET